MAVLLSFLAEELEILKGGGAEGRRTIESQKTVNTMPGALTLQMWGQLRGDSSIGKDLGNLEDWQRRSLRCTASGLCVLAKRAIEGCLAT